MIGYRRRLLLCTVVLIMILAACGVSVSPSLRALRWQSGYYTCARWSWNGEHIVPADGSAEPQRLETGGLLAMQPAWSPRGDVIAFSTVEMNPNRFYLVNVPAELRPAK